MRNHLVFRPGEESFENNVWTLYQDCTSYYTFVTFRGDNGTETRFVDYVRCLHGYLGLGMNDEEGKELRIPLSDVVEIRAKARRT